MVTVVSTEKVSVSSELGERGFFEECAPLLPCAALLSPTKTCTENE